MAPDDRHKTICADLFCYWEKPPNISGLTLESKVDSFNIIDGVSFTKATTVNGFLYDNKEQFFSCIFPSIILGGIPYPISTTAWAQIAPLMTTQVSTMSLLYKPGNFQEYSSYLITFDVGELEVSPSRERLELNDKDYKKVASAIDIVCTGLLQGIIDAKDDFIEILQDVATDFNQNTFETTKELFDTNINYSNLLRYITKYASIDTLLDKSAVFNAVDIIKMKEVIATIRLSLEPLTPKSNGLAIFTTSDRIAFYSNGGIKAYVRKRTVYKLELIQSIYLHDEQNEVDVYFLIADENKVTNKLSAVINTNSLDYVNTSNFVMIDDRELYRALKRFYTSITFKELDQEEVSRVYRAKRTTINRATADRSLGRPMGYFKEPRKALTIGEFYDLPLENNYFIYKDSRSRNGYVDDTTPLDNILKIKLLDHYNVKVIIVTSKETMNKRFSRFMDANPNFNFFLNPKEKRVPYEVFKRILGNDFKYYTEILYWISVITTNSVKVIQAKKLYKLLVTKKTRQWLFMISKGHPLKMLRRLSSLYSPEYYLVESSRKLIHKTSNSLTLKLMTMYLESPPGGVETTIDIESVIAIHKDKLKQLQKENIA